MIDVRECDYLTIPAGTQIKRRCPACGVPLYFVPSAKGKPVPVSCFDDRCVLPTRTTDGLGVNHFRTCTDPKRFSGRARSKSRSSRTPEPPEEKKQRAFPLGEPESLEGWIQKVEAQRDELLAALKVIGIEPPEKRRGAVVDRNDRRPRAIRGHRHRHRPRLHGQP